MSKTAHVSFIFVMYIVVRIRTKIFYSLNVKFIITDNSTNVPVKDQTETVISSASSHLENSALASSSSSTVLNPSGDIVSTNSNKSTNRNRKRKPNSSKFKYTLQDHLNV